MTGTTTIVVSELVAPGDTAGGARSHRDRVDSTTHVALLRTEIERHGGRLTGSLANGATALFGSAYEGVRAAVGMQQAIEQSTRNDPIRLTLRVGANVGEVVDADDDLFSAAVLVARRLCDRAAPGEVLVSDLVRLLVGTRHDLTFEPRPLVAEEADQPAAWGVPWTPLPVALPFRVVVADDAPLIRAGIVRLLAEGGFEIVGEANDLDTVLAAVDATKPDLLVTDIRMPPTNTDEGLRAASTVRANHPRVAVLVLSQHIEARSAAGLLDGRQAGIGYLLKERVSELNDFLAAARTVAAGGSVIDPLVAEQLLRRRRHDEAMDRLTERERDVLALMAQGKSNAAIAAALVLGSKTVETHVRAIFQKLDLEDNPDEHRRVLAVVQWLEAGR